MANQADHLRLFNSLTGSIEPYTSTTAKIYVCGITPDESTHLGHLFTYVTFDALIRYMRYLGKQVTYVQNITDVDDDILAKARDKGTGWRELRDRNMEQFLADNDALNNMRPDVMPAASEHIPDIISITEQLVDGGHAYVRGGNVYFRYDRAGFGKLSGLDSSEWLAVASERGNDAGDELKDDDLDFPLWQRSRAGEPEWDSPFGPGRPGWHIECSAMSMKYLGPTLDIHGGGHDLIFPHHEAEIAQSECATGKRFADLWMHVAMLRYEGRKMSKSLGNIVFASDLLARYSPNAVRLMLLSHHYRSSWEYTPESIEDGRRIAESLSATGGRADVDSQAIRGEFFEALNNDLDTPTAIRALVRLADGAQRPEVNREYLDLASILGLRLAGDSVQA